MEVSPSTERRLTQQHTQPVINVEIIQLKTAKNEVPFLTFLFQKCRDLYTIAARTIGKQSIMIYERKVSI